MSHRATSFHTRALAAVALLIGFYVLAVAAAVVLFAGPLLLADRGLRLPVQVILPCWIAAATIGWAILPRIDRFDPPFPRLTPEGQPRLFALLGDLARRTGQAMPAEVYALPDVNAWVAQRGGVMGIGGRRVMGIGLPLMQTFSQAELEATIAHEFGHFHAGDTRLGPLVHKTRAAIERTLEGLQDSAFQMPFRLYAGLFLRTTQAISRHQEHTADRLAATTVGAAPLIAGLRKMPGLAPAYDAYWQSDFGPAINGGVCPPLLDGFRRFLGRDDVRAAIASRIAAELTDGQTDPLDSHPSIPDRIRALAGLEPAHETAAGARAHGPTLSGGAPPAPDPISTAVPMPDPLAIDAPALALLDDVPSIERALVETMVGPDASRLEPLTWEDVGPRRILPGWQAIVRHEAAVLAGVTPLALPAILADATPFARRIVGIAQPVSNHAAPEVAAHLLAMALGAALGREGWRFDATPEVGAVTLFKDGEAIEPHTTLHALRRGEIDLAAWSERCAALGIADLDLGGVADVPDASSATPPGALTDAAQIAATGETAARGAIGAAVDASLATEAAAAKAAVAEPRRFRPLRWVAVMLTVALVSNLPFWMDTATGMAGAWEAVRLGMPVWTLLPVAMPLALLPFIVRNERGIFASMVLVGGASMVVGVAALLVLARDTTGFGLIATIPLNICYALVGGLGSSKEGTPLGSPLARLALLGRHAHLRAVRELGQQAGWSYVEPGPGRPQHVALGTYRGRHSLVSSTYVVSWTRGHAAVGKAPSGYVLDLVVAAPFTVNRVVGGQSSIPLPPEIAVIARELTIGRARSGLLRFRVWSDQGAPIHDATRAAIAACLDDGAEFLQGAQSLLFPSTDGHLVLTRASSLRVTEDAPTLQRALDWLCNLATVLEGDAVPGNAIEGNAEAGTAP